jgi:hypothetical protein
MSNEIPPPAPPIKPLPFRVITDERDTLPPLSLEASVDASGPQAPTPVQALARVLRGALLGVKYGTIGAVFFLGVVGVGVQVAKIKYPHLAAPLDTLGQIVDELSAGLR